MHYNRVYTSREEIEVHRFTLVASIGVPLLALFLQAFIPVRFRWFTLFDLPLLVTIFFAVARRSPIAGLLTGAAIGIAQDSLTHQPLGLYGIAKTVIGYVGSSLGVRVDVENPGSRFLMTLSFFLLHQAIYYWVGRYMAEQVMQWRWGHQLWAALANAMLATVLFVALDRLKKRE